MRAFVTALLAVAIAALVLPSSVAAVIGGAVSEPVSVGTFQCVRNEGWEFVIVRGYCSYGGIDPNGLATLQNARAAGIAYHDVYHFPCRSQSAASQVQATFNHYKTFIAPGAGSMLWFDIETNPSPGCGWSGDLASNCVFLGELIQAAQHLGVKAGVYASEWEWSITVGSGCSVGAQHGLPLWYPHYDQEQSYSDFVAFGGWSKPSIKQYWDGVGYCGISADANWYP